MSDVISRQAAITAMTNYFAQWAEYTAWSKTVKAMVETAQEAARKMLTELPSEQVRTQMSSAELISRKAAIDAINTWDKFGADERYRIVRWYEGLEPYVHLRDVVTAIVNLPSAQPEIQN